MFLLNVAQCSGDEIKGVFQNQLNHHVLLQLLCGMSENYFMCLEVQRTLPSME